MESKTNKVKNSAKFISENSKHVKINLEKIQNCSTFLLSFLKEKKLDISNWHNHPLHPSESNEKTLDWIFLVDTLNFAFWSNFIVKYKENQYSGYSALLAAINRAIDNTIPITQPEFLSKITLLDVEKIFHSESEQILLIDKRCEFMNQLGQVVLKKFNGKFINVVRNAQNDAEKLLDLIIENFPSFRDESVYKNQPVFFYKRAQILVADIWGCFEGKGIGKLDGIDNLTMFPDYRVPQCLNYLGIIEYSDELMDLLKKEDCFIEQNSEYEIEIRGNSVWGVELLKNETLKLIEKDPNLQNYHLNSVLIDFFLYDYAKKHHKEMQHIPIHKTKTWFY
ncbi:queuosine salvage protein [Anaeramoeba ignava]|uniref:Queuosine 5'-phosphate N-glycosylase/hydrolase n=1 Tax=Anaeramoeba ignava TaxID=1746090 RepID=A0A9Q0R837_ANAIG|nr:queuosine salvage protein [Anaeramoeba ignava]